MRVAETIVMVFCSGMKWLAGSFCSRWDRRMSGEMSRGARSHGFVHEGIAEVSVRAMMHRVGLTTSGFDCDQLVREEIVLKCMRCEQREACRDWLADQHAPPDAYRDFCLNAGRFEAAVKPS